MPIRMEVEGLDELRKRFAFFPKKYHNEEKNALVKSIIVLWENVPPYPPPPPNSTYIRTGMLGRSFGSDMGGGKVGQPDIFEVRYSSRYHEASFGSRLGYAPDVVGQNQDPFFKSYWWNIKTIADNSKDRVLKIWQRMTVKLARYLDGKG